MNRTDNKLQQAVKAAISLVLIVLFGVSAAGCSTIQNLISPKTTTTTEKASTTNGPQAKDLKTYPNDAPGYDLADLPRYPGSLRQSFSIVKGEAGKSSGVILYQTADSLAKVTDYYEQQIEKYDWKIEETIDTRDGRILRLSKGTRKNSIDLARREGIKFTDITFIYREY